MRIVPAVILVLTSLAPLLAEERPAAPAPAPAQSWQSAEFFPILPWDWMNALPGAADRESGIASTAECGFTIAGFIRAQDLGVCERLGLPAIVAPDAATRLGDKKNPLTDAQIDDAVRTLAEATRGSPAVMGYFIRDEPGARSFPYLAKIVAAVKKHAPGKLAYINLFPGYATLGAKDTSQLQAESFESYLEQYVEIVKPQFISYDDYMVEFSMDFKDPGKRAQYFKDLLTVRKVALAHQLPFWNIVSSNQIRPITTPPSPANLLLQAWTTLAAGGRGVSWYKYTQGGYRYAPLDKDGRRTVTWTYLQMVNQQVRAAGPVLNGLHSTGVYFAPPTDLRDASPLPGRRIAQAVAETPLMIGEFAREKTADHVVVVNLSLERSTKVALTTADGQSPRFEMLLPGSGQFAPLATDLWLTPGQGALLRIPAAE